MSDLAEFKLVLGLEIHMHVKTKTKMFCRCDADIYGAEPNTHTCPTCLGLPGALPVPNAEAIRKTQLLGHALGCTLAPKSFFDRKHYFYPDLPKGYQITQHKNPLCVGGALTLGEGTTISIEKIHLEEDTAKSFHEGDLTLIDFNKSGMPLIEIVTEPVIVTVGSAMEFAKTLQDLVRHLGISEADMEKGQLRIEPNISLRTLEMEKNNELPTYKVEVKNINSFRFMEKAVNYEIVRQTKLLAAGESVIQENRGFDEKKQITVAQRTKEDAQDYRYFPEPDIPPMEFESNYFADLQKELTTRKLPWEIRKELVQTGVEPVASGVLTTGNGLVSLLPQYMLHADLDHPRKNPRKVANILINKPEFRNLTKEEFMRKLLSQEDTIDDTEKLLTVIQSIIVENPTEVEKYKNGDEKLLNFLLGQVMRHTHGKANPESTADLLKKELAS